MYHPRFYGRYEDIGAKYGQLISQKVKDFELPVLNDDLEQFGKASISYLSDFYPEVIDEISSFSEALKIHPNRVLSFLLSLIAQDFQGRCSVFAKVTDNGVFFGRNYDMPKAFKKYSESSLTAAKNTFIHISQSDVFIGRCDGINEKGLAIGMSYVDTQTKRPGVSFHFIVRRVLEYAENVIQAIEIINDAHVSSANNFLIADKHGDICIVESSPQTSNVIKLKSQENSLHITNHFKSRPMRAMQRSQLDWSLSAQRSCRLKELLKNQQSFDIETTKKVLADTQVCLKLKEYAFETIWSTAANLSTLDISRSEGYPKSSKFKQDTRMNRFLMKTIA
ncbi:C45 family autoproteolytic acyltransferase/hydrolase [Ningiella sp. W23]|uniref:C45 family autoproteolytic acyltransferase/hydolase n=1 Tax=Ningiella sp. W23 TaxID=3023715 RepID=UPI003756A079